MRSRSRRRNLLPMEDTKFPVPEGEAHKLDTVIQTLQEQPLFTKLDDAIRSQPWAVVLGAFAIGLLCSVGCGRR